MEIILIPIIAALVTAGLGKRSNVWISTLLSLIPLAVLYTYFNRFGVDNGWKTIFDLPWISENIRFAIGFDGLTGLLLLLTNLMVPVIVLAGIRDDENRVKLTALTLFMQGALNGVFMAQDGLMFYIFWELALIPIYFIEVLLVYIHRFFGDVGEFAIFVSTHSQLFVFVRILACC
jgi:NADH-quinone oxidoreductase subunit M